MPCNAEAIKGIKYGCLLEAPTDGGGRKVGMKLVLMDIMVPKC